VSGLEYDHQDITIRPKASFVFSILVL